MLRSASDVVIRHIYDTGGCCDVQCTWMKDGKMVRLGDRYEIVYSLGISSLEVAVAEPRDAGKYTCVAENSQGTEECTCKVTVNGATYYLRSELTDTFSSSKQVRGRSHWPCNQVATYVRPVEQPNRRGSQINRATSRGGRGQSRDQNQSQQVLEHVQKSVSAISDRRRSHTGLT